MFSSVSPGSVPSNSGAKVLVIACRDQAEGDFEYNPSPKTAIKAGMKMIFIGSPQNRQAMAAAVGANA